VGIWSAIVLAGALVGPAQVIDGDTLRINGAPVRLIGIDAFEPRQMCGPVPCGEAATRRLSQLVEGRVVICHERRRDRFGRAVATCRADGVDLSAAMTLSGLALPFRSNPDEYAPEAARARAARAGVWADASSEPVAARREADAPEPVAADPGDCRIKGNINSRGEKIYHMPGTTAWNRTRAEQMFCTEEQARIAGFRAPRDP
jgi:endonuclease YncB( thermonuclease family)